MKAYLRVVMPCRVSLEGGRELGAGKGGASRQKALGADGDAWGRTEPCTGWVWGCDTGGTWHWCDIIWHL